ncbi:MAG: hypothetical protein WC248_01165 [Candidatus Methanomethylophilaceae archaeon]|jgi:uncharacterized membrane protein (UPF0136 family)
MVALLFIGIILFIAGPVLAEIGYNLIGAIILCFGVTAAVLGFAGIRLCTNLEEIQASKKR